MNKLVLTSGFIFVFSLGSFAAVVPDYADNSNGTKIAGSSQAPAAGKPALKEENNTKNTVETKSEIKTDLKVNTAVGTQNEEEIQMEKNFEQEPEVEQEPKIEKPKADKDLRAESFIVPDYWTGDGLITGEKDKKLLISTGDTVYVTIDPDLIKPGLRCDIYRKMEHVKDKRSKTYVGYEVRRIGRLEFTNKIGSKVSSAKIVVSYEPIQIDDIVKLEE